jgi:hypothetical protein
VSVMRPSRRRPGRSLLVGAVALGAAALLSGCGRTGVAATVDGHDISVDHLQSAVASLRAADKAAFGKVTDTQVLSVLLYGPYAEDAASAAGKGISDDAVRQAVLSQAQQNGDKTAKVDELNAAAIEALRANIAFAQLDDAARKDILDRLAKAHVKVSPRYGSFDAATGAIKAPSPNWLPTVPTPTASPSATG